MRRIGALILVATLGVVGLAGCGSDDKGNTLSLDAHEFAFDGAPKAGEKIKGGRTTVEIDNTGKQFHLVAFEQVTGNKTDADLAKAVKDTSGDQPDWIKDGPGIDTISPGQKVSVTVDLKPGRYTMVCFLPDTDNVPHLAKGMYTKIFTVSGDSGAKAPDADATVTATKADYTVPKLDTGEQTLALKNADSAAREFWFIKLPAGKTIDDLGKLFESDTAPKPPYGGFTFLSGAGGVAAGATAYAKLTLDKGNYVVADVNGDQPKFKPFTVS